MKVPRKRLITLGILAVVVITGGTAGYLLLRSETLSAPKSIVRLSEDDGGDIQPTPQPVASYEGKEEVVANAFTIKVPNGWKASIADSGSFQAIMFARPEQLNTLKYDANTQPVVDRNGIPAWNGLTEHFYVRYVQPGQQFDTTKHTVAASADFSFDDGTAGTMYYVVKHADEAREYGGLLRDDEWQGRVYSYEKSGKRVETHLALYPSSKIDVMFYEAVTRSMKVL